MTDFLPDLECALETLKKGGTILYPTDTVWGLGCDATDEKAVDRIYALKNRPAHKSMIVLVADKKDVLQYVAGLDMQVFDYLDKTDRPTTVIYDGAIGLADNVINQDGTVAIRIVKDTFCRHLIKRLRKPLVSTSANCSGSPAPGIFAEISNDIRNGADYVVRHRQEETVSAYPSSVVKWNRDGTVTVIR